MPKNKVIAAISCGDIFMFRESIMAENIVQIEDLRKSFGEVKAVDGISLEVKNGDLFAFLGINGAGKSTTINILCSIIDKDSGKVFINGLDLDKDRARIKSEIGVVFQRSVLDPRLSVRDNLTVRAALYGIYGSALKRKLGELTDMLDLSALMDRQFGKLSGGQKRRVDIARGLINSPKLLILDEPTTGLDPQTRRSVWGTVDSLMKEYNMTVFLTTHYMEEAGTADDVVIIDTGKVVAHGTPNELKNRYSGIYLKAYRLDNALAGTIAAQYNAELTCDPSCASFKLKDMAVAAKIIAEYQDELRDFEVLKGDMDDVFLNVTGKKLEGGANG